MRRGSQEELRHIGLARMLAIGAGDDAPGKTEIFYCQTLVSSAIA